MSLIRTISSILVPVHPEGYYFILLFAVITVLLLFIFPPLGYVSTIISLWCAYFFRDPPRVTPQREGLIISPADGRVSMIEPVIPPPELDLGPEPRVRISIFMNIFDCHVNRSPISGHIRRIVYTPGLFLNADLDKASKDNERNSLVIETKDGDLFGVVQIAGLVARRIVCFVKEGSDIETGERFGLIRFGSRVDLYLPVGKTALVVPNQRMIGGETVVADLNSTEPPRAARSI